MCWSMHEKLSHFSSCHFHQLAQVSEPGHCSIVHFGWGGECGSWNLKGVQNWPSSSLQYQKKTSLSKWLQDESTWVRISSGWSPSSLHRVEFCSCFLITLTWCCSEIPGDRGDPWILILAFSGLLRLERENMPTDPQQRCVHFFSSVLVEAGKGEHGESLWEGE